VSSKKTVELMVPTQAIIKKNHATEVSAGIMIATFMKMNYSDARDILWPAIIHPLDC
jgi:hypothetical protein